MSNNQDGAVLPPDVVVFLLCRCSSLRYPCFIYSGDDFYSSLRNVTCSDFLFILPSLSPLSYLQSSSLSTDHTSHRQPTLKSAGIQQLEKWLNQETAFEKRFERS